MSTNATAPDNPRTVALVAKSRFLIQRFQGRSLSIDEHLFPTAASERARTLLIECLRMLDCASAKWEPSPNVLHKQVFRFEEIVQRVERSSSTHISWPVVSFCTRICSDLLSKSGCEVFFSRGTEHNFGIYDFSDQLDRRLLCVIPKSELSSVKSANVYCLLLPSLEEDNIPLYANVAHEFGHIAYKQVETPLIVAWLKASEALNNRILDAIQQLEHKIGPEATERLGERVTAILMVFAQELTADIFAALLVGPSFLLSLSEMAWGFKRGCWNILLTPALQDIRAYPSFDFRNQCLQSIADIRAFCRDVSVEVTKLEPALKLDADALVDMVLADSGQDEVVVQPEADIDATRIANILQPNLSDMQAAITSYVAEAKQEIESAFPEATSVPSPLEVAHLLVRLHHSIPPNIIPDGTLLGRPAGFATILTAASIYRLYVLAGLSAIGEEHVTSELDKIHRLTTKAFEVSYVQAEFNDRGGEGEDGVCTS